MTLCEAAKVVLSEFGEPLHLSSLCNKITERGLYCFTSDNPQHYLGRILAQYSKSGKLGCEEIFYRFEKATYGLAEWAPKTSNDFNENNFNPAKILFDFLKETFQFTRESCYSLIDDFLGDEETFEKTLYNSVIYYLCRRLVYKAKLITKTAGSFSGTFNGSAALQLLRDDLENINVTNISLDVEKLAWLLRECIRESKHKLPTTTINKLLKEGKTNETSCYICGRELDYDSKDKINSAEIEHVWPKYIGGSNTKDNLKISCRKCNKAKNNSIGAEDFHFESLFFLKLNETCRYDHKLSVILKDDCKCALCGKNVTETGSLFLQKKDTNDLWHFINMVSVCADHKRGTDYEQI